MPDPRDVLREQSETSRQHMLRRVANLLDGFIYSPHACKLPGYGAVDFVAFKAVVVSTIREPEAAPLDSVPIPKGDEGMSKHTPVPWYVGSMNDKLFVLSRPPSPSGTDLPPDTPHPDQFVIANPAGRNFAEERANAILIASAPETAAELARVKAELTEATLQRNQLLIDMKRAQEAQDKLRETNRELVEALVNCKAILPVSIDDPSVSVLSSKAYLPRWFEVATGVRAALARANSRPSDDPRAGDEGEG
jgi:hypothetical protein